MAVARIGLCLSPPCDTHPIFLHTVRSASVHSCATCALLASQVSGVVCLLSRRVRHAFWERSGRAVESSAPQQWANRSPSIPLLAQAPMLHPRIPHIACVICDHNALCHLALSRIASQCCMSHVAHADFFFSLSLSPQRCPRWHFHRPEALIFSSSYFKWYTKRVNQQTVCMTTLRAAI